MRDRARTTARRRTPNGRSTPTGRSGCSSARPITTLGASRRPGEREPANPRRRRCSSAGSGAAPGRRQRRRSACSRRWTTPASSAPGDVLVTHMTSPDWVPLMRTAAAIVTDSGGMTCHAAIVSRELGIPCVVGTGDATTQASRRRARHRRRHRTASSPRAVGGRRRRRRRRAAPTGRVAAARAWSPARGCSSTCPSPRRSSARPRSTSTASACSAPS